MSLTSRSGLRREIGLLGASLLVLNGLIGAGIFVLPGKVAAAAGPVLIEDLGPTTLLLIYAYVGFESLCITAGETSDPKTNLPRALIGTTIAIALVYFLIVLVFVAVVPPARYATATLVDVGRILGGSFGALGISLAAVFSICGNLSQSMIAAPRLLFALGENRMLCPVFAYVSPRFHTPAVAVFLMGVLALILALSGTFVTLAVASSVSRLLSYLLCICALPTIRRRRKQAVGESGKGSRRSAVVPGAAFLLCCWLITQTTAQNWIALGILLTFGAGLYTFSKWHFSRAGADDTPTQDSPVAGEGLGDG